MLTRLNPKQMYKPESGFYLNCLHMVASAADLYTGCLRN